MSKNRFTRIGQRGDTIVEVLISVAVVSMVLATAYAIANRNLSVTQDTQEHNQALQVAQQQIEGLRVLAPSVDLTTQFPAASGSPNKCVTATGTPAVTSGVPCSVAADGSTCITGACYKIEITQPSAGVYDISVTWASLTGKTSRIALDYGI